MIIRQHVGRWAIEWKAVSLGGSLLGVQEGGTAGPVPAHVSFLGVVVLFCFHEILRRRKDSAVARYL